MNQEKNECPFGITMEEIRDYSKEIEARDHDPRIFGPAGRGNFGKNLIEATQSFNDSPFAEMFYRDVIQK